MVDQKSIGEIFEACGTLPTLVVVAGFVILCILICCQWHRIDKFLTSTKLFVLAASIFIVGLAVYTVGALQSEQMGIWDALYTLPSAFVSSLGMFIYQDDISELSDAAKHNSTFMAIYSLVHLAAAMITAVVLIRLIIMRLYYWRKLRREMLHARLRGYHIDNLYLFWGVNPRSVSLAESIVKEDKSNKNRIVFVDTVLEESNELVGVNVSRLFDFIKIKHEAERRIKAIGALLATCHGDLASGNNEQKADLYSMLKEMELSPMVRLIKKSSHLHMFFLSNDEDNNINCLENAISLTEKTKDFIEGQKLSKKVYLYCHARHSANTRWAEIKDICNYGKNPRIHIVDSSYLSVFCLKDEVKHHPVSFVNIDAETATVTSPFHSMVIGFGETGQEALKFLYEFGAFVDKKGNKTKFHCTVIDKKASELEGLFYAQAPAMKERTDTEGEEREIRFLQCPIDSIAYWETIKKEIESGLNYLVISIDNEELAINTAINICSQAVVWRGEEYDEDRNSNKLHVYIRSYNNDTVKRLKCIETEMKGKFGNNIELHLFGSIDEIFRYDIVVDNKYLNNAKKYHKEYNTCLGYDDTWEHLFDIKDKTIWNIEDAERRRDQNISNALHALTKMEFLEKANVGNEDKEKLENLARLEHERWVAASRLQGQQLTTNHEKDISVYRKKHKLHTDLVSWDKLRPWDTQDRVKTQSYDHAVVKTTREMVMPLILFKKIQELLQNFDKTSS